MKYYSRYYLITVTDKLGKIVREQMEYSGHSATEEMMILGKEYPNCEISSKFIMEEV